MYVIACRPTLCDLIDEVNRLESEEEYTPIGGVSIHIKRFRSSKQEFDDEFLQAMWREEKKKK